MAVQRSPDIFRQIRQPEESVRLAAVQAKGENIRYVSAPSEAVQLAAVRNDPMNIRYIENPTEKVQSVVLNADRDAAPFISVTRNFTSRKMENVNTALFRGCLSLPAQKTDIIMITTSRFLKRNSICGTRLESFSQKD